MIQSKPIPRKDGFFGLHFDLHPYPGDPALGADVTEEMIEKLLVRTKPDWVQYDCKGHTGWIGCPVETGSPVPHLEKDSLAIWRKVTRKYGVALGIHYSGVWDNQAVLKNPEWAVVGSDGKIDDQRTSTFGPYVDELMIPQLTEVIQKYDIDAIWADGECWGAKLDWSPAALAAWQSETGQSEAPKDKKDPHWLEWKNFHRRQFEKYLCHWVDALHAVKPDLNITSNWMYTTMAPWPVHAKLDYISGDYDPLRSVDRARTESRFLTNLDQPWDLLAWGFAPGQSLSYSLKGPDHLKQEAAVVLMHGGGFMLYYQPTRSGHISDTIIATCGQVADFCRERQSICHRSKPVPQVAVLFSSESQMDKSDNVFAWWDAPLTEVEGALHALLESHFSTDVLTEYMLKGRMQEYGLIVIPNSHRLTDEFRKELLEYVHEGGQLMLLGDQCAALFQNETGVKHLQQDPASIHTLAYGQNTASVDGRWQEVESASAEVLAWRYPNQTPLGVDPRLMGIAEASKPVQIRKPAATLTPYGKGQILAVHGSICQIYWSGHHPTIRKMIGDTAARMFPERAVTLDAPSTIDLSLRKAADGRLCLHLLNLTNMPLDPNRPYLDFIPDVGPFTATLKTASKPSKVEWIPSQEGETVDWEWRDGELVVKVPRFQIHGVLAITD